MYSLHLTSSQEQADFLSGELWEAGTVGIREQENGLIASFETNCDRANLLQRFAAQNPRWMQEDATDWIDATHRAWPPRLIGNRIFLAPHWCADATPAGRIRLIHNPGLACGTGEHPCTQLALAAIESLDLKGKTVVDAGTGSGLLAIAALQLGAQTTVGVDPDEAALHAARENFELNHLPANLAPGSVDCLRDACAHVTIANISATVLMSIGDELLRVSTANAHLILTGFREYELPAIEETFGKGTVTSSGEWRCVNVPLL